MASKKSSDTDSKGGAKPLPTADLVEKLAKDSGAESRADVASAMGATLDLDGLSAQERAAATEIIRALAADVELHVRECLGRAVADSPRLDPDIAKTLAGDDVSVATPVLTLSSVLSDSDLMEIVNAGDESKQLAIAGRAHLSATLSGALVDSGTEPVVAALVSNPGAELDEPALGRAIDRFGESERIQGPLVGRAALPIAIAERLVSLVSERLREELLVRHALPEDVASDLVLAARERATLNLSGNGQPVEELVAELHRNGRLSGSIMVRAACTGDIPFLEASLATKGQVPLRNARALIHDPGGKGFDALIEKAGLPAGDKLVLRCAVDVVRETEMSDRPDAFAHFGRTVIERVLTTFDADQTGVSEQDAAYLVQRLEGFSAGR
ncbi:MAG: DUF2336 domain-containing protein [Alphaproteobacteria bacterium]|nr:DUF2336 domain-containing protein [Alphaproteobacteria bacterium]